MAPEIGRLRRTASYSNIQIKEATNEEEDEDDDEVAKNQSKLNGHGTSHYTPDKNGNGTGKKPKVNF